MSNSAPPLLETAIRAYRALDLTHGVPVRPRQLSKRARRLTERQLGLLVQRYQAGATVYDLAAEFHIARATASKHLKAAGVVLRCGPLSQDEINQAIDLYATGLSVAAVGEELGRDHASIWRALKAAGVPLRDTHGRVRES